MGPRPHAEVKCESMDIFTKIFLEYPAVPDVRMGFVDVRDCAEMHVKVLGLKDLAGGRYIASGHNMSLHEIAGVLTDIFGQYGYKPTRCVLPTCLVWFLSLFSKEMTDVYKYGLGPRPGFDCSLAKENLSFKFRPRESTLEDMGRELIESGAIE